MAASAGQSYGTAWVSDSRLTYNQTSFEWKGQKVAYQPSQYDQPVQVFKFSAHHFKAEEVDEQAFAKWYVEEQECSRMVKTIREHGITEYKLYITPGLLRFVFQADLDSLEGLPGWKLIPYGMTSSYWANPDQLTVMLTDPDWENEAVAFEKDWVDTSRTETQIGREHLFLPDAKIINVRELKEYP